MILYVFIVKYLIFKYLSLIFDKIRKFIISFLLNNGFAFHFSCAMVLEKEEKYLSDANCMIY